jgi:hypothetical protein
MIIQAIDDYSVTVTLDVIQAAAVLQTLHLALGFGFDEEVAERLSMLGTEITPESVSAQIDQVVDSLARAVGMEPFCECTCGDKSGEAEVEEGTTETEDAEAKPIVKPN